MGLRREKERKKESLFKVKEEKRREEKRRDLELEPKPEN